MTGKRLVLLGLPVLLLLCAVAIVLLTLYTGKQLTTSIEESESVERVSYDQIRINPFTWKTRLKGLSLTLVGKRGSLYAERVGVADLQPGPRFPYRLDLSVENLTASLSLPQEAAFANRLSEKLARGASLHLVYSYQPENRALAISRLYLDLPGCGTLTLSGLLVAIDLEGLLKGTENPLVTAMRVASISISHLALEYQDDGLVKELVAEEAAREGLTPASWAARTGERIKEVVGIVDSPRLEGCLAQLVRFLENPGRLTLSAGSEPPLAIGQLWLTRKRDVAIEKLGLEIQAYPRPS